MHAALQIVLLVLVLVSLSCTPSTPTQVLVIFDADALIRADADRLFIEVRNQDGQVITRDISFREGDPQATTFPVTFPLVPKAGDPARTYEMEAELFDRESATIGRARVSSGYVADELREISVRFDAVCRDVDCGDGLSCVDGVCETACVDLVARGGQERCRGADAGVDAAPLDAGFDASLDETGCDDAHAEALFCNGFEEPGLDLWDDAVMEMGEVSRVSESYRGSGGLRVATLEAGGQAYLSTNAVAGIEDGPLFVRVYLKLPAGEPVVDLNFFFAGEFVEFTGMLVGLRDDEAFLRTLPIRSIQESGTLPRGRWICLEARSTMRAIDGSAELWVDGESAGESSGLGNLPSAPFTAFTLGIPISQDDQPPIEMFIDEVVISHERIGCD